ncbi:MAG TPA: L-rhamnose/proton symporter RhaT [Bryobacteraceae bacterium]|nr:L-rhamnose/proton symporter RhaT [Bryobacteraceae bacterium]
MNTAVGSGILLGIVSGALLGVFALPMKAVLRWRWENTWLMYCVWSLLILPWGLAFLTVPGITSVLGSVSSSSLAGVFLFGFGWGIGCVLFGLGLKLVGLALGTAIVLGLNNALGAILPLFLSHEPVIVTAGVQALIAGVFVMLVGVVLCSWAGVQKERESAGKTADTVTSTNSTRRARGILICVGGGIIGTCFNLALVFGGDLNAATLKAGASELNANNAVWCISLLGGFIPNVAYCSYLLTRNSGWKLFTPRKSQLDWFLAFAMGLMWLSGVAIYGMSVQRLGKLGASIGWALIQSTAIIAGNISGVVTGEWRGTTAKAKATMAWGLFVLILGIAVVGWSAAL